MLTRKIKNGLTVLCLTVLSACSSTPVKTETVTALVPIIVQVPSELTQPVTMPDFTITTNSDMADMIIALRHQLDKANGQLRAIREIQP